MEYKFRYGSAGDFWPVKPGDIWQIGPHILACGDHEKGAGREFLDRFGDPQMTMTDPPYNQAAAQSYRTKAMVPGQVQWQDFIKNLLYQICRAEYAVIETGVTAALDFIERCLVGGMIHEDTWEITYFGDRPCRLSAFHRHGAKQRSIQGDPTGLDEQAATEWAVEQFSDPGSIVFDPCMGQGLTAVTCHKLGRIAYGTELHPRRLAVTIDKLAKLGLSPARIGGLECMKEHTDVREG